MWEIWANLLLPKALKSCPKSKKSPNLVTLFPILSLSLFVSLSFLLLPLDVVYRNLLTPFFANVLSIFNFVALLLFCVFSLSFSMLQRISFSTTRGQKWRIKILFAHWFTNYVQRSTKSKLDFVTHSQCDQIWRKFATLAKF